MCNRSLYEKVLKLIMGFETHLVGPWEKQRETEIAAATARRLAAYRTLSLSLKVDKEDLSEAEKRLATLEGKFKTVGKKSKTKASNSPPEVRKAREGVRDLQMRVDSYESILETETLCSALDELINIGPSVHVKNFSQNFATFAQKCSEFRKNFAESLKISQKFRKIFFHD